MAKGEGADARTILEPAAREYSRPNHGVASPRAYDRGRVGQRARPEWQRRGTSKPARTYILTPEAELLFSRAYAPVLTQLLHVLDERLDPGEFDGLMRALLNELGGLARVEEHDHGFLIRGYGCPLAAATQRHPEACNAVESLLSEFAGVPVAKCCDAEDRLRCCFEIQLRSTEMVP